MLDIARLLEKKLADNRSGLRTAAKQTVAKASLTTTIRELLASEAGEAIRQLTIGDLEEALVLAGGGPRAEAPRPRVVAVTSADSQSREEFMYRRILEVLAETPGLTIGQLAKQIDVDTTELRGYVSWMRSKGKISSVGRARATRYSLAPA
ncbi:winged helix-turn-helix domain-containing protein [Pseudenhygromyxa sp. WMMC2535]|uniref:winged helix-turn-helix domain-containing protein n=1 Tax=Pseudenhygromyxa sp. WMMC2535 TaxID=2712867 RepID=UPI001552D990|nr:winged helix-turn-helix domain-containing protein [Pseudenhygromyxa sp. WMMC2535]NVB42550.1 winged helix-turn-helix domain-containing protein [Pseudenhygromyxa sp. WMMC2535]